MILLGLVYMPVLISSVISLPIGPPLVTIGFSPSEQLFSRGFSSRHDGGEGGRGKSEKGRNGSCSDQTERVGRRRKDEGSQTVVPMSLGEEVSTLSKYPSVGST